MSEMGPDARDHSGRTWLVAWARSVANRLSAPGSSGMSRRLVAGLRRIVLALRAARAWPNATPPPAPATDEDAQYSRWLHVHGVDDADLRHMGEVNAAWRRRPLISVVVPVYNPEPRGLEAMIASVCAQVYDNWELCLADDRSTDPRVAAILDDWTARDPRITVTFRAENGNIAAASNSALHLATGEFVALLDHDDVLQPHALHAVVAVLQDEPTADLVYSDEDKILVGGGRGQVTFKGDFDPDYILSTNYVSHLSVFRRTLVMEVGGFRAGFDGSQDHDLVLRVAERATTTRHIPDVLYSWRQVPGSAALAYGEKPAAWTAGLRAVQDALDRRGTGARAEFGPGPGTYAVRHPLPPRCRVHVLLLADDADMVRASRTALGRRPGMSGVSWHVAGEEDALERLRSADTAVTIVPGPHRRAHLLNVAARTGESDVLVFLSGDLAPAAATTGWLAPLVEQVMRDQVGICGGRILAADGGVEHEGLHVGGAAIAESIGVRYPVIQGASAVSGACLAIRTEVFAQLDGFDERFHLSLHDIDLCLRARRAGLACVYTPLTELRHLQRRSPSSAVATTARSADDVAAFLATWGGSALFSDPFVSPWLRRVRPLEIRER